MPLDPQAKAVLDQLEAMNAPPLGTLSPEETRATSAARRMPGVEPEPVHHVEDRTVPGPAGEIPVRVYRPSDDDGLPLLVYFHGGGWVIGDLESEDARCRSLANQAQCVVVSVAYRLAPEHPFPAAVDDAYAATKWAAEHPDEFGVDASRVAIAGCSAGANLAAVVAQWARDRGGPALVHQTLVYPVTDHAMDTPSYSENAEGYLLTRHSMEWFWGHYLSGGDGADPAASPLRAESLSGLPPALVITAEFDPLRDEGEAYARRMRDAGVDVTCTRYDGQIHAFFNFAEVIDQGAEAVAEVARHLRAACSH